MDGRIRRCNAFSAPPPIRDMIIQSEFATLQFLEKTEIPAPKAYDMALESSTNNTIGVGYILLEKLPGTAMKWRKANEQQREKVMDQLADIFIELKKYPFDHLGSLNSSGHVGPFVTESTRALGPCQSLEEYHTSSLQFNLDLILRGEMYTRKAVDAYLIYLFLIDLIPLVLPSTTESGKFYLKHADDKGDHIMVDDDWNITGMIDWEWAHTASPAHAFDSPTMLLPVIDFYNGMNALGADEIVFVRLLEAKGQPDLADYVRKGRLQHRFAFCCDYDEDWKGFIGLFQGLRAAVGVDQCLDWNDWKFVALDRYKDDIGLQKLLDKH